MIQTIRLPDIVIDYLNLKPAFASQWKMFEQLDEFRASNAIGTVNCYAPVEISALVSQLECCRNLLVVAFLCRLAIVFLRPFAVNAAGDIVELGCGHQLVVGKLGISCLEGGHKGSDKTRARRTGITSKDDLWLDIGYAQVFDKGRVASVKIIISSRIS